jgi:hypothetical protein
MSERSVFPEPATTKGGGDPTPGSSPGGGPPPAHAATRRLAPWLIATAALAAACVYGLFLDRSIRPDPFAPSVSLGDWLLHPLPHPALARMPVVPIGAHGSLTVRPAVTGWINSPYLPGSGAASADNGALPAATPFKVSLIPSAHAADAPQAKTPNKVAPPNAPVLDPEILKKREAQRVTKEPQTYGAPVQQTAEKAVAPAPPTNLTVQESAPPPQQEEAVPEPRAVEGPTGPPRILHAQFLADGKRGWVGGDGAGILTTEDGGKSWTTLGTAPLENVRAFRFDPAGRIGWAATNGEMFGTESGGENWATPEGLRAAAMGRDAKQWPFAAADWVDVGAVRRQVAAIPARTFVPVPVAAGYLFTTADGQPFELPGSRGERVATIREAATTRAQELGEEPGRFHAVLFRAENGEATAWAAGDGGILVRMTGAPDDRESAGDEWTQRETPTQANLRSLYFQADGQIGWAASGWDDGNEEGERPVILQTLDGGATWQRLPYRHLPAPWVFLALPAFILTAYRATTTWLDGRRTPQRRASVADEAASDAPIGWEDRDALGLHTIARALSKFVRNRNTIPPLTFAVSGPWGTGKSSLMNLVAQDLRTFGTRPVWFNAWHHQKEEHLLAALLEAIRSQAIPSWWRWSGLTFRRRLLWRRVLSDLQSALAVAFLLAVAGIALTLLVEADDARQLADAITTTAIGEWLTDTLSGKAAAVGSAGATLYAVALALLKLRVITLNPAQLMASLRDRSRISDFRDQLGFRHKFDREFEDVCHALRTRRTAGMVIMIDDLDRCQPDNVLDILEAVNYLATAGPCFIFLGIDTEKVTSSVAHGFKDSILVLPDGGQTGAARALEPDAVALATFARSYLEKLINITVPIPTATAETSAALLDLPPAQKEGPPPAAARPGAAAPLSPWPGRMRRWLGDADDVAKGLTAFAVVACVALSAGVRVIAPQGTAILTGAPSAQAPATAAEASEAGEPATESALAALAHVPGVTEPGADLPQVAPGDVTAHPLLPLLPYLPPLLALLLVGWWTAGRVLTVREAVVEDSADFREALRIFNQAIFAASPTPRGVKRFENRLRYFAMRSRGDDRPPDWIDHLFGRLGHRVRTEEPRQEVDIPEPTLVALGAIAGVAPEILRRASGNGKQGTDEVRNIDEVIGWDLSGYKQDADKHGENSPAARFYDRMQEVHLALSAFEQVFSGYWPPSSEQIRAFCDLSGTIRD